MNHHTISAPLRSELRADMGRPALVAIQDHLYHKALGYFDPAAVIDTTAMLELSELAHRLRDHAEGLASTNPLKIETMRLAKIIWNDFAAMYKIAMRRNQVANPYAAVQEA